MDDSALRDWILPPREGGPFRLSSLSHLPWRSSFPQSGSCCVSKTPRGFLHLSAGVAVIGKIGGHVRLLPQQKKKKKRKHRPAPTRAGRATALSGLTHLPPIQAWIIHAWCDWILREGPSTCHAVPYASLAMEKQSPPERVAVCN